ncbi:MAG: ABC transporter ATP-binding protein [Ruminococcaceae bacterium]|nr:ABC transporter ATP-binding protein [Oscillospiraceae bacterium]
MENAIEIRNLNKHFGEIHAVNDLSFTVKKGAFFAFLGVNGAGKSTTIQMISGRLTKDSGSIWVDGMDISQNSDAVHRTLGIVFQNSVLDASLSVYDNLRSRAALYGITGAAFAKRYAELSSLLDFDNYAKRPLSKLSGGQKRRIDIARALIHDPKILILDEPTTGLDPQTRHLIWQVLTELRQKQELTVFLTTHYMEEAADADYVVILDSGKIAAEGTPLWLKNKYTGDYITFYSAAEKDLSVLSLPISRQANALCVSVPDTAAATRLILSHPSLFTDYEITKGKMDDVFLAVTGKHPEGGGSE